MTDDELMNVIRRIEVGGIGASTVLILEDLAKLRRALDAIAGTLGNIVRSTHSLHCRLNELEAITKKPVEPSE